MNHYLSEKRIWLQTTPCVEVLDGKSILIIDGESEYQSRPTLSYENSDDHRAEKCTVSAQKTFEEAPLWQTPHCLTQCLLLHSSALEESILARRHLI